MPPPVENRHLDQIVVHISASNSHVRISESTMSFDRQLDALVAVLAALVTFVGCLFSGALTVGSSSVIAVGVFLAGFFFGRRIVEITLDLFGA
jgi:hypothetical protein